MYKHNLIVPFPQKKKKPNSISPNSIIRYRVRILISQNPKKKKKLLKSYTEGTICLMVELLNPLKQNLLVKPIVYSSRNLLVLCGNFNKNWGFHFLNLEFVIPFSFI